MAIGTEHTGALLDALKALGSGQNQVEETPAPVKPDPKPKKTEERQPQIRLRRLEQIRVEIPVVGTTPLIIHKWSEKAKRMMREKQQGQKARGKQDPKDPQAEAEASTYYLEMNGQKIVAAPAAQFKAAMVGAVRFFDGITMVQAKQSFFVEGLGSDHLLPIEFGRRVLREDPVRNQTGVADLRYRYAYFPWSCVVPVKFLPVVTDLESVFALLNAAGLGGIGDWRPSAPKSNSGTFGQFKVDDTKEVKVIEGV